LLYLPFVSDFVGISILGVTWLYFLSGPELPEIFGLSCLFLVIMLRGSAEKEKITDYGVFSLGPSNISLPTFII
jgi:hypothetical protein